MKYEIIAPMAQYDCSSKYFNIQFIKGRAVINYIPNEGILKWFTERNFVFNEITTEIKEVKKDK